MKKLLVLTSVIAALTATNANAYNDRLDEGHPYAGLDLNFVDVKHDSGGNDDSEMGVGVSFGYKMNSGLVYVAPEVFYDYADTIVVHRYGARVNVGYDFTPRFSLFANAGVANAAYDNSTPVKQSSYSASDNDVSPIFGFGVTYNLNSEWALKAAYDRQEVDASYEDTGSNDEITLDTVRIGLLFNF